MNNYHKKPVTFVDIVALKVTDLDKSIKYYKEIIGFSLLRKDERRAELTADGKRPLLILEVPDKPQPKKEKRTGLYHFALLLPNRSSLASFLQYLIALEIPLGASDHYVSEALYLNDPDGNGIEVYSDRPSSHWRRSHDKIIMTTDPLDSLSLLKEEIEPWQGLPENTIMGHIHLHVSNLEKASEFYVKGLGFQIVLPYYNAIFLSDGGYHHHIGINTWQGKGASTPEKNSAGLSYYNVVFGSEAKRKLHLEALKNLGYATYANEDYYITQDPSGNKIHLVINI